MAILGEDEILARVHRFKLFRNEGTAVATERPHLRADLALNNLETGERIAAMVAESFGGLRGGSRIEPGQGSNLGLAYQFRWHAEKRKRRPQNTSGTAPAYPMRPSLAAPRETKDN